MIYHQGLLLTGEQARRWLEDTAGECATQIDICTAYLKDDALKHIIRCFMDQGFYGRLRILTRWQLQDLVSGASDICAYETASSIGADIYINLRFHGKIYRISGSGVVIGSANLTSSGFGLKDSRSNVECCSLFKETLQSTGFINDLFDTSCKLSLDSYRSMRDIVDKHNNTGICIAGWPQDVLNQIEDSDVFRGFLVDELFQTGSLGELLNDATEYPKTSHDLSLLSLNGRLERDALIASYLASKPFKWLHKQLLNAQNHELYFGELTSRLHDMLLDDPAPYRSDVKILVSNMLGWANEAGGSYFIVDRPSYSQRIKLIR